MSIASKATIVLDKSAYYLVNKVPFTRRIFKGAELARDCKGIPFQGIEKPQKDVVEIVGSYTGLFKKSVKLKDDVAFVDVFKRYAEKSGLKNVKAAENMTEEDMVRLVMQNSGVGPNKFMQIISSNEQVTAKLPKELQTIIMGSRSNNTSTRTLKQMQKEINQMFGRGEYRVTKELGVGTIGEAYLVKAKDGTESVAKIIKKGVDEELLNLEEEVLTRYIRSITPDAVKAKEQTTMVHNLYKDWKGEINFVKEFDSNKALAQGAERYAVADITKISKDARCVIYDKAPGIQMDKLVTVLKDYKANPAEFAAKYKDLIAENPWLAEPQKVIDELPKKFLGAFNEMFLFMKKGGQSVMHGDPHSGNVFINSGKKGLYPVFIDTGNCVVRSSKDVIDDVKFLSNYFIGNSNGVADYMLSRANSLRGDVDFAALKPLISADVKKIIFGKMHNVTNLGKVQVTMEEILKKHGLALKTDASTAIKAQLQFSSGVGELCKLKGTKMNPGDIIGDVPIALGKMVRNGINPIKIVKDSLGYAFHHQEESSRIASQFMIKV